MTIVHTHRSALGDGRHIVRPEGDAIGLPAWVDEALERSAGGSPRERVQLVDGVPVRIRDAGRLALCSTVLNGARELGTEAFKNGVSSAYLSLFRASSPLEARHRIRMWSFIPEIHAPRGEGLSTYHVFNIGRYEAFARMARDRSDFSAGLPTATGVGHAGADLVVHCLTAADAGISIENPRQIPAYRYSARYGPRPPCFARGTIVGGPQGKTLLIGGTASIRREDSVHPEDLDAQLAETFENLTALVETAAAAHGGPAVFRHLRSYCARAGFEPLVGERLLRRVGPGPRIEMEVAELCRQELLVEIEGVVELGVRA